MQIMKTRYFIIALSLAGMLFSCKKAPQNDIPAPGEQMTISVTIPDGATKAGAGEVKTLSWTWSSTDKLTIVGETTEVFSIKAGFTPKKAEFTGTPVKGEKFSIYYPDHTIGTADWSGQVQKGNNNLDHLSYAAAITDADQYSSFSFSADWAEEHGGSFSQIGVLKFVMAPPTGTSLFTEVSIATEDELFYSGNGDTKVRSLSLSMEEITLGAGEDLVAWMVTSCNEAVIPSGTPYTVTLIADGKTYAQKISKTSDSVLKSGQVNVITLADPTLWKDDTPRFASGEGTAASPYIITTIAHLKNVGDELLAGSAVYFKLGADIDMTGLTWTPISCDGGKQLVLDGDGHTISHLGAPLVDKLNGTVQHLTLDAAAITISGVGGILAASVPADSEATISDIQLSNSSISATSSTGGVLGQTDGKLTMSKVTVTSTNVSSSNLAGGVVGFVNHSGTATSSLDECSYISGTVSASARYCGGLVGSVSNVAHVVSNSLVKDATITSTKDRVGGALGQLQRAASLLHSQVENVTISGGDNTAGVIGVCYGTASRCSVTGGSVTSTTKQLGGFTAYPENATITDCYAVTTVNGGSIDYVGGFVGLCKGGNTVTNCYEACSVSGTATNIGAFIGYIDTAGSTVSKCIAWEAALPFVGGVKTAGQDSNVTDNYIGTEGTVSAKAQSMGWSADIWDFSGDFPKLK